MTAKTTRTVTRTRRARDYATSSALRRRGESGATTAKTLDVNSVRPRPDGRDHSVHDPREINDRDRNAVRTLVGTTTARRSCANGPWPPAGRRRESKTDGHELRQCRVDASRTGGGSGATTDRVSWDHDWVVREFNENEKNMNGETLTGKGSFWKPTRRQI